MTWLQRVVGVLVLSLLSACSGIVNFEKPQVNLAGLEVLDLGLLEQKFVVSLRVTNPNDMALPIDGLKMKLDINGQPFAKIGRAHV